MKKFTLGILSLLVLLAMTSVVAAFPSTVTADVSVPGSHPSYFDVKILTSTDPLLPPGDYTGWCSDSKKFIDPKDSPFTFTAYSTLITNPPPVGASENWYKVNYIINNDVGKQWQAIQAAFWSYDGGIFPGWNYNAADYTALTTGPNGADTPPNDVYVPKCNEKYAVMLYDNSDTQTIFIETTYSCSVPEFPSMALPVGMLIGLVGLVLVIKTREH